MSTDFEIVMTMESFRQLCADLKFIPEDSDDIIAKLSVHFMAESLATALKALDLADKIMTKH